MAGLSTVRVELESNALTTINAAANLIRAHVCSFAIYPEGTRSKSGKLLPWQVKTISIKGELLDD